MKTEKSTRIRRTSGINSRIEKLSKKIVSDVLRDGNYFYCGDYYDQSGLYRKISHEIKFGDDEAIAIASEQMAKLVPPNSILVPIPSHDGTANATLKLANAIASITGSQVIDALKGKSRESLYVLKKKGVKVDSDYLGFFLGTELPNGKNVVFIDNVIATGTTANAALKTVDTGSILAYALDLTKFRIEK